MEACGSSQAHSPTPNSAVTGDDIASSKISNDEKTVKITVQKQHTRDLTFLVKRNRPLGKLMLNYCLQMGLNDKGFKFTYLGKPLKDSESPLDLQMEDEDVIDCWDDMIGGSARAI
ncbi:hypothetical protein BVRB_017180 [Beta vulgaris subsp. vulgaris]|uniref:Ubiquitin-like domain-containing protein n=1 Tax=Beta vulgaris subsp. vulgaris TaxID=3555 RepID=A0A0J7YM93_BETVV|nr:uncharacterized protein LOC104886232 [Beta vulgaris subsp. vulgaris]KMS64741.1 hypothetical protein BVRB_017180 [Beta vulgaris subsp. vulgaris]